MGSTYALQDAVVVLLPYMLQVGALTVGTCYVLDPTMKQLVYTALPASYQNWLSFVVCLMEEIRILGIIAGTVTPVVQSQIIAFGLVTDDLQCRTESMKTR